MKTEAIERCIDVVRRFVRLPHTARAVTDAALAEFAALESDNARLREDAEAAMRETGNLREAVTEALGMQWHEMPQPFGDAGYRCPDDTEIVTALRAALSGEPRGELTQLRHIKRRFAALLKDHTTGKEELHE